MHTDDVASPACCELCGQPLANAQPSPDRDQAETMRLLASWMVSDRAACTAVVLRVFDPEMTLAEIGRRTHMSCEGVRKSLLRAAAKYPSLRLRRPAHGRPPTQ